MMVTFGPRATCEPMVIEVLRHQMETPFRPEPGPIMMDEESLSLWSLGGSA